MGDSLEVEPAKKRLLAEPGELPFGVAPGGLFEFFEESLMVCFGLGSGKKVEALAVADGLGGREVLAQAGLIEFAYFVDEARGDHLVAPLFDAGVNDFFRHMQKPATKIVGWDVGCDCFRKLGDFTAGDVDDFKRADDFMAIALSDGSCVVGIEVLQARIKMGRA